MDVAKSAEILVGLDGDSRGVGRLIVGAVVVRSV